MMLMYGSTIFIIEVTERPVRDPRLWYAPWLVPGPPRVDGRASRPRARSCAGSATSWRRARPGRSWSRRPRRARKGAQGPAVPALLLGRADAHPRPRSAGRVLRARPDPHPRRTCSGPCWRASRRARPMCWRPTARWAPRRGTVPGRGWRHRQRGLAAGHVGPRPASPRRVRERTIGASYGDAFLAARRGRRGGARTPSTRWNPVARTVSARATCRRTRASTRCGRRCTSGRATSRTPSRGSRDDARRRGRARRGRRGASTPRRSTRSCAPSRARAGSCSTAVAARA